MEKITREFCQVRLANGTTIPLLTKDIKTAYALCKNNEGSVIEIVVVSINNKQIKLVSK